MIVFYTIKTIGSHLKHAQIKANFAKNMDVLNGLDSSKFSEILYSNATPNKFSIYQVKITFKHLSFVRKAYLYCRKRQNPPGNEVLNFLFFRFILDYKYQNNLF